MQFVIFILGLYVPQTAWLRHVMRHHSQLLGDVWDKHEHVQIDNIIEGNARYPKYFNRPLHGFQNGGLCRYQAMYQSPSMRYIMRLFQGNPFYRESVIRKRLDSVKDDLDDNCMTIDLGCGTGDSTWAVNDALTSKSAFVSGVDLSPYMIEIAKLQYDLNFVHANAARLPFPDNSVDLITSFAMFHEMPKRYSICVLEECNRVLKPGGHLVLWDQKITTESAITQECKGAPSIEPYLSSYARLNITDWLLDKEYVKIQHSSDKFMQEWYARKDANI